GTAIAQPLQHARERIDVAAGFAQARGLAAYQTAREHLGALAADPDMGADRLGPKQRGGFGEGAAMFLQVAQQGLGQAFGGAVESLARLGEELVGARQDAGELREMAAAV